MAALLPAEGVEVVVPAEEEEEEEEGDVVGVDEPKTRSVMRAFSRPLTIHIPCELVPDATEAVVPVGDNVAPELEAAAEVADVAPLEAHDAAEGRATWTLSQNCLATCVVFCLSESDVHAFAIQQDIPSMKALSEQMHLGSK